MCSVHKRSPSMSSLPDTGQSTNGAKGTDGHDSTLDASSSNIPKHETASETRSTPDRTTAKTWPATRSTSHQPSEGSDTTQLGGFYDGGVFDNASSVTLQDEFPWHEVGVSKSTQRIPSTIVPALLQGISSVSPTRSSFDGECGSRELDENPSDLGDVVPGYSAVQKGKWKVQTSGDVMDGGGWLRSPSPQFHFESIHNVSVVVSPTSGTNLKSYHYSPLKTGSCITGRFCKITRTARRRCPSGVGWRFQYVRRRAYAHLV